MVWLPGGLRYGDLVPLLAERGGALHNLASLPHITVAGATATGTHGSGNRSGSLSTSVTGLELVRSDGSLVTLREGDADFAGEFDVVVLSNLVSAKSPGEKKKNSYG